MQKYQLLATAAAGIEALVGRELRDLGYQGQVENGRVRFEGTIEDVIKTNLWLHCADRIKIVVGEFDAYTFDDLFEGTKALAWEDLLPLDANFPVEGRSRNSKLHNVPSAQAIVKGDCRKALPGLPPADPVGRNREPLPLRSGHQ